MIKTDPEMIAIFNLLFLFETFFAILNLLFLIH